MAKAEYRSSIRSKKLIQEALGELLMEKSLERITVTDIVNRAGINRGTFYAHYTDIPDLLNHLIKQMFAAVSDKVPDRSASANEVAHIFLESLKEVLIKEIPFYRKIMNSSSASVLQEQLVHIAVDYFLTNEKFNFEGVPADYELTIRFCAGGVSNLYRDWFLGRIDCTLDELTNVAEAIILKIIHQSGIPDIRQVVG